MMDEVCYGCKTILRDYTHKNEERIVGDRELWHIECWQIYANTSKALKDNLEGV